MHVELRIRGAAVRIATSVFGGFAVHVNGTETVVSGLALDEADALALIDRARNAGLSVVSWRVVDSAT